MAGCHAGVDDIFKARAALRLEDDINNYGSPKDSVIDGGSHGSEVISTDVNKAFLGIISIEWVL